MTGLTGGANFLKYLLFLFNFLFVLTGLIILSIGVVVRNVYEGYAHFLDQQFFSVSSLLIAIGSIIFVIAFFGCCGAYKENYCMTLTFSCLLIIVFILELAAGISGFVLKNQTISLVHDTLNSTMPKYGNVSDITYLWDHLQNDFDCCGLNNVSDWKVSINATPMTCCKPQSGMVNEFLCNETSTYLRPAGCVPAFGNYIQDHAVSLGAAGISLAIVQFIGIFMACYISKQIKTKQGHSGF